MCDSEKDIQLLEKQNSDFKEQILSMAKSYKKIMQSKNDEINRLKTMEYELKLTELVVEKINNACRKISALSKPKNDESHIDWDSGSGITDQPGYIINDALTYSQTTIFCLLGEILRLNNVSARLATHITNSGPIPEGLTKDIIGAI